MAGRPERFTVAEVCEAIRAAEGLALQAGKALGCDARTIRDYAKRYATVRDALKDAREDTKDEVESLMLKRIREGSDIMAIFFAKTQMKDRGYVERSEITGADAGPLAVTLVMDR